MMWKQQLLFFVSLTAAAAAADEVLLVANAKANNIVSYSSSSGTFLGEVIPAILDAPDDLAMGPDGGLYVSCGDDVSTSVVVRCNLTTAACAPFARGGGMHRPTGLAFSERGELYVASSTSDSILRFSPTGSFLGVFAAGDSLNGPSDIAFRGNDLLVTTAGSVAGDFSADLPSSLLSYDAAGRERVLVAGVEPSEESMGFVSLLGIQVLGDRVWVSDYAGEVRVFEEGEVVSKFSTNLQGTVPMTNFVGNLAAGATHVYAATFLNYPEDGAILRIAHQPGVVTTPPDVLVPRTNNLKKPVGIIAIPSLPSTTPI